MPQEIVVSPEPEVLPADRVPQGELVVVASVPDSYSPKAGSVAIRLYGDIFYLTGGDGGTHSGVQFMWDKVDDAKGKSGLRFRRLLPGETIVVTGK